MRHFILSCFLSLLSAWAFAQDRPCDPTSEFNWSQSEVNPCCFEFHDLFPTDDLKDCRQWTVNGDVIESQITSAIFCAPEPGVYRVCYTDCCNYGEEVYSEEICHDIEMAGECHCCIPDHFEFSNPDFCNEGQFTLPCESSSSTYEWDFGDGTTASDQNPYHIYIYTGIYNVCVTIHCPGKEDIQLCQEVDVNCCSPELEIFAEPTENCCIHFTALGMESEDVCSIWEFGDGTVESGTTEIEHCYEGPGPYVVIYTTCCMLDNGSIVLHQVQMEVFPQCHCCPIALVEIESDANCTVHTNVITECQQSPPPQIIWNWGDGTTSTGTSPTHSYRECGTYTIVMTAYCYGEVVYQKTETLDLQCGCCTIPDELDVTVGADNEQCMIGYCINGMPDPQHHYCSTVWWGDGTSENLPIDICPAHFYTCSGDYEIRIQLYCCDTPEEIVEYNETVSLQCASCCDAQFTATCNYDLCYTIEDNTPGNNVDDCETWKIDDVLAATGVDAFQFCFTTPGTHVICHHDCCIDFIGNITYTDLCDTIVVEPCDPCINQTQIDPQHLCPQDYDPVCGCDGVTYPNSCAAYYLGGVTHWTAGACCCMPTDFTETCTLSGSHEFTLIFPAGCDGAGNTYTWDFGDGTSEVSTSGTISHTYGVTSSRTIHVCVTVECENGSTTQLCNIIDPICSCSVILVPIVQNDNCKMRVTFQNSVVNGTPLDQVCIKLDNGGSIPADQFVIEDDRSGYCGAWGFCIEYFCCNNPSVTGGLCEDWVLTCCCPKPEFEMVVAGCCVTLTATDQSSCVNSLEELTVDINLDGVIDQTDLDLFHQQCCYFDMGNGDIVQGPGPVQYCYEPFDYAAVTYHTCCQVGSHIYHFESTQYSEIGECCSAVASFGIGAETPGDCVRNFVNTSVYTGGAGSTVAYTWNFGDGTTSALENPSHSFTGPGPWNVCLTIQVFDPNGQLCATNTACQPITIPSCASQCDLDGYDFTTMVWDGCQSIRFQADIDGSVTTEQLCGYWTVDGIEIPFTGLSAGHVFDQPGVYTVCLYLWCCTDGSEPMVVPVCHDVEVGCPCCGAPTFTYEKELCDVSFAGNNSMGIGGCWTWNFGDGSPEVSGQNVTHVFAASGDYEVCLSTCCIGSTGEPHIETTCETIHVNCSCDIQPDFIEAIHDNCISVSYLLTNNGTTPLDELCVHWDFGDGTSADVTGPSLQGHHTYSELGFYEVCATVWCCSDPESAVKICHTMQVGCECDEYPADFSWVGTGCTLEFTGQDIARPSSCWIMDFGDGTDPVSHPFAAMQTTFIHTFPQSGTYHVCMTNCCIDPRSGDVSYTTICHDVVVVCSCECCEPDGFDVEISQGCNVNLDAIWELDCLQHPALFWDLGDGQNLVYGEQVEYSYEQSGTYTICLMSKCGGNEPVQIACQTVEINCCCLPFNFNTHQDGCMSCFSAIFECDHQTTCITWDYGDGETGVGSYQCHEYAASGEYEVCMNAVCCEDPSQSYSVCKTIEVVCACDERCEVQASFYFTEDACKYEFFDNSIASNGYSIISWNWTFDAFGTSTLQNPNFTFPVAGEYTVCLEVVSSNGFRTCTDEFCWKVKCGCPNTDCGGVTDIKWERTSDLFTIAFSGTSTPAGCQKVYSWDFGDGTTSFAQNPTHTYAIPGTYEVCLTITFLCEGYMCQDTDCETIVISTGCDCPESIPFTYLQTGPCDFIFTFGDIPPCLTLYAGHWSFGANVTGNSQAWSFTTTGAVHVCLTLVLEHEGFLCEVEYCQTITLECGEGMPMLENPDDQPLQVVPNPNTGEFKVILDSDQDQMVTIDVQDNVGRNIIRRQVALVRGRNAIEMELESVRNGSYVLTASGQSFRRSVQLIIEK